jgi:hypothetical protein
MDGTTIFRWIQLSGFAGSGFPPPLSQWVFAFSLGFNLFAKAIH